MSDAIQRDPSAPPGPPGAIPAGSIVLLDLNFTLVSNSIEGRRKHGPNFLARLAAEEYRGWLIDLIRGCRVALVTARPASAEARTLERILAVTGWQPDEAYFNALNERPPQAKQRALTERIFPKHGRDAPYLAIESNAATVAMYRRHGIPCMKAVEDAGGRRLAPWGGGGGS